MKGRGFRKTRSDKKKDVKPFVNLQLKESIYNLAHVTSTTKMDLGLQLVLYGLKNKEVIDDLSLHFKKNIKINNVIYIGHVDAPRINIRRPSLKTERINMRVPQDVYKLLEDLGYAADCSEHRIVSYFLRRGMSDIKFLKDYARKHLVFPLSRSHEIFLQYVLDHLNAETGQTHYLNNFLNSIRHETPEPLEIETLLIDGRITSRIIE